MPTRATHTISAYALPALPLILAVLLYGYAVRLPFFLDDLLLFDMIRTYPESGVPGLRFWGGAPQFTYYRPLVFSLWEMNTALLGGRFDPFGLHLLNVLLFGFSGVILGRVVVLVTGWRSAGLIAGCAFVLFPFSYNAVIWVASLFHVLMAFAVLLALWAACIWLRRGRILALILAWVAAFVAIFSHENGVLLLPLLIGMLVVLREPYRASRMVLLLLPLGLMLAAFAYAFVFIRTAPPTQLHLSQAPESFGLFAQAFVWPLSSLARVLLGAEESALLFYVLFGVAVLPTLYFSYRYARRGFWWLLYGLLWYVLAALPAVLLLAPDYIRGSWRLLLLSSAGQAWFWGVAAAMLLERQVGATPLRPILRRSVLIAALAIGLFACAVSVAFLLQRRDDALRQSAYTWALQAELLAHTRGDKPLVINPPQWLAPVEHERLFPTLGLGVQFMGGYVNYYQMIWAHTGQPFPQVEAIFFRPGFAPPDDVSYAPYYSIPLEWDFTTQIRQASDLFVTRFEDGRFYPLFVGRPGAAGHDEALQSWLDGDVMLTAAHATLGSDNVVTLATRWQVTVAQPVTPYMAVYCDDVLLAESDHAVWGGIHPFRVWLPGETQSEVRHLPLPMSVAAACLHVTIGLQPEANTALDVAATPYELDVQPTADAP